ncbi:dihydrolipoyl dehydrogenase [Mycoplasmopsis cynos]|uniref:dihydrolipoyl dehydrogenase n=1 Tax=Mycoplasmopsis cynos TaxID=171284 RepID=UPI002AFEC8D8|nr:dihydrolipoyl dehydrogenase [Mycoplasmopsis cynos]WQQ19060.1 dihydrolipoyl dehydrogenase [Mycoplasmopsis cynos]
MYRFKFADIGEGLHEGVVAEIYKKEGDVVNEGDSLFSVETDKVTSDIPSPVNGKVIKVLMTVGDTIHVGQEIFLIDDGDTANATSITSESLKVVKTKQEQSASGASVVGEVKVSNQLFDLSELTKVTKIVEQTSALQNSIESIEHKKDIGKVYNGKIEEEFDVIVIGSGPGGYVAAEEAGSAGLKTLIIEREFWGGVCLNVGCIPTKALLKSVEVLHLVNRANEYGIDQKLNVKINWDKMHERKRNVVKQLTSGIQTLMRMNKVKTIFGEAKFVGSHEIEVDSKVYYAKNIIIATGSTARKLSLPGFKEGYKSGKLITSKTAINLEKQPKSITIIGGGVIGCEFAQVFATAGTKVTILQNTGEILPMLDKDIIKQVTNDLKEIGVKIIVNATTTKFENNKIFYEVNKKESSIESELVLVSVGRVPESLGLEEVGIKLGKYNELLIDEHCRTNIDGVYGIGDVVGQAMLAHVAYRHACVAVSNILNKPVRYSNKTVPACIYTHPEIAVVGLTEEQAKAQGKDVIVAKHQFTFVGKSLAAHEPKGFAKFVVDKEFGEIIGCHIIGPSATDLISEVVLAMDLESTIYDIAAAIHPHPTFSEILWEAARSAVRQLQKLKK